MKNVPISIPKVLDRDDRSESFEFLDIATNDAGSLLYAWASIDVVRGLIVYQLTNVNEMSTPISISYYDYVSVGPQSLPFSFLFLDFFL